MLMLVPRAAAAALVMAVKTGARTMSTPLGEKSSLESGSPPDRIHLYRRAILEEWIETDVRLDDLVRHVTIHEIGHHFGLSDEDMHALEDAAGE